MSPLSLIKGDAYFIAASSCIVLGRRRCLTLRVSYRLFLAAQTADLSLYPAPALCTPVAPRMLPPAHRQPDWPAAHTPAPSPQSLCAAGCPLASRAHPSARVTRPHSSLAWRAQVRPGAAIPSRRFSPSSSGATASWPLRACAPSHPHPTPPFLLRYTSAAASTSATAGSSRVAKKGELELELQLYVMLETPLCVCLILFIFVCAERINDHLEFILV